MQLTSPAAINFASGLKHRLKRQWFATKCWIFIKEWTNSQKSINIGRLQKARENLPKKKKETPLGYKPICKATNKKNAKIIIRSENLLVSLCTVNDDDTSWNITNKSISCCKPTVVLSCDSYYFFENNLMEHMHKK